MAYVYRDGDQLDTSASCNNGSPTHMGCWTKDPELRMFDRFDVDGSGHLERHELMKVGKEQTV